MSRPAKSNSPSNTRISISMPIHRRPTSPNRACASRHSRHFDRPWRRSRRRRKSKSPPERAKSIRQQRKTPPIYRPKRHSNRNKAKDPTSKPHKPKTSPQMNSRVMNDRQSNLDDHNDAIKRQKSASCPMSRSMRLNRRCSSRRRLSPRLQRPKNHRCNPKRHPS